VLLPGVIPQKHGNLQFPLFASKSRNLARASSIVEVVVKAGLGIGVSVDNEIGVELLPVRVGCKGKGVSTLVVNCPQLAVRVMTSIVVNKLRYFCDPIFFSEIFF
jgi:hypothetical protein